MTKGEDPNAHRALPSEKTVADAGEILIKDKDGNQLALKSVWSGKAQNERQLIIFIRHFFCGVRLTRPTKVIELHPST